MQFQIIIYYHIVSNPNQNQSKNYLNINKPSNKKTDFSSPSVESIDNFNNKSKEIDEELIANCSKKKAWGGKNKLKEINEEITRMRTKQTA